MDRLLTEQQHKRLSEFRDRVEKSIKKADMFDSIEEYLQMLQEAFDAKSKLDVSTAKALLEKIENECQLDEFDEMRAELYGEISEMDKSNIYAKIVNELIDFVSEVKQDVAELINSNVTAIRPISISDCILCAKSSIKSYDSESFDYPVCGFASISKIYRTRTDMICHARIKMVFSLLEIYAPQKNLQTA